MFCNASFHVAPNSKIAVSSFALNFNINLSLSFSNIGIPPTVLGHDSEEDVPPVLVPDENPPATVPCRTFNTLAFVSITVPFLSVILSPTTLYLFVNSVVDNTSSACGLGCPFSVAFAFKFL